MGQSLKPFAMRYRVMFAVSPMPLHQRGQALGQSTLLGSHQGMNLLLHACPHNQQFGAGGGFFGGEAAHGVFIGNGLDA
jgi:hypothetical protein